MNTKKIAGKIESHFASFGIYITLVLREVIDGSRLIYEIKVKKGTKTKQLFDRVNDIRDALGLPLLQLFREGQSICLAVSDKSVTENSLRKMLESPTFHRNGMWLPIALGYDIRSKMLFADLIKMPHAMYAGSTNSGKSVGLLCMILSIICKQSVNKVNLLLFDVGANTMEPLGSVPHLSYPIVKDTKTGIYIILELIDEMERRIKLERNILRNLPAIICVIDEYVSLITNIGNRTLSQQIANSISNLLRRGRHAKIHMVLATQDPTIKNMKVDVGNITARMAFTCAKYHNSITILGEGGAEKLPGKGTMLFKSSEHPEPVYLQGAFMTPDEIKQLVARITSASHDMSNKFVIPEIDLSQSTTLTAEAFEPKVSAEDNHKELAEIILWTLGRESVSKLQIMQKFRMGNRADVVVDGLFKMNLVADKFVNQPRAVIPTSVDDIPAEVLELLLANGVSVDNISEAIAKRPNIQQAQ